MADPLPSNVVVIGGATDAGKTTVATLLAERHGLSMYAYDRQDVRHLEHLAATQPHHRAFLDATMDERWVSPTPEGLFTATKRAFHDRFPLVLEDLARLAQDGPVVAEGYGLLPELIAPLLRDSRQAIWLLPTPEFKRASMERRGKPQFGHEVSDRERARRNLLERDMLIAQHIEREARARGLRTVTVDGSRSAEKVAAIVGDHFGDHLQHPHSSRS